MPARVAQILNDPRIRRTAEASRDCPCPDETVFVGGWHNTSSETVTFFDLDRMPETAPPRVRVAFARSSSGLRPRRPRALPAVRLRPAHAVLRRGAAACRGAGGRPGTGSARMGARHQRHQHRRPARLDPRPVPRSAGLPHFLRSRPGRCRAHDPDANPSGRLSRLRRHHPRILFLLRR